MTDHKHTAETPDEIPNETPLDFTAADNPDALFSLEGQLAAAEAARDEERERCLRITAELENYRKRAQKEIEQERQYRVLPIVRDLLPTLDNLQRTLQAAQSASDLAALITGVKMVAQQFEETLGKHAVKPIAATGQPFDPNLHEAISQAPSADHPPMTVLMEVERGYQLHDRVVRPTKVIVSTAPSA